MGAKQVNPKDATLGWVKKWKREISLKSAGTLHESNFAGSISIWERY